jgi:hypothetical protein
MRRISISPVKDSFKASSYGRGAINLRNGANPMRGNLAIAIPFVMNWGPEPSRPPRQRATKRRRGTRLRATALDRRLAAGEHVVGDARLVQRAAWLASPSSRERLAGALRDVVSAAARGPAPGTKAPIARSEVAAAADELDDLARRLQEPGRVDPRGVAEAWLLVTDGSGPL